MPKLKSYLVNIQNIFLILSSIVFFQGVSIYDQKICNEGKVSSFRCNLIQQSMVTKPSNFLISALTDLKNTIKRGFTTSGRIVKDLEGTSKRFNSIKSGFNFYYEKGSRDNAGYLLLSASDPNKDGEPLIELWDMNNQELIHKWNFKFREIKSKTGLKLNQNSITFTHPLLLSDGSLIVSTSVGTGPLIKFSKDGEVLKVNNEFIFHHSVEIDTHGRIYAPIRKSNSDLYTDGFAILDKDLNILETHFLLDIYRAANLEYELYSEGATNDPFHLNDVEPLQNKKETEFVLISLANQSSILAYDLKKRKVVWILKGYSVKQHDPDFVDEDGSHISIFDNNRLFPSTHYEPGNKVNNNIYTTVKNLPALKRKNLNEMKIYNKASNDIEEKSLELNFIDFNFLDEKLIPRTVTEGLSDRIQENNSIFIEETNYGRLLEIDFKENILLWQYINKDSDEKYFMMAWSRRIKEIPEFETNTYK